MKNILFNNWNDKKFKKLLNKLIEHKLIYLDRSYNSNILLTSKSLSILNEKNIKNNISTDKITDITLDKNRFLLTLKNDFGYINNKNFEVDFINCYLDYFIDNLNENKLKELKEILDKKEIKLINLNTIAIINNTSIFTLKNKLKDLQCLDIYLNNINTIILNKSYIEKITDEELMELNLITKKYKSIYTTPIRYILI